MERVRLGRRREAPDRLMAEAVVACPARMVAIEAEGGHLGHAGAEARWRDVEADLVRVVLIDLVRRALALISPHRDRSPALAAGRAHSQTRSAPRGCPQ